MKTNTAARTNTVTAECFKCLGKGRFESFNHVSNGVCFQCKGTGTLVLSYSDAELAQLEAFQANTKSAWEAGAEARKARKRASDIETIHHCVTKTKELLEAGYKPSLGYCARIVRKADADVKARAVAAFAKLGIDLLETY